MGDISGKLGTQADASDSVSREMQSAANVQSQSMSELNMTVDQLSVSVNEIADNATKLAGVVADTKDDSVNVGNKMRETVEVSRRDARIWSMSARRLRISAPLSRIWKRR